MDRPPVAHETFEAVLASHQRLAAALDKLLVDSGHGEWEPASAIGRAYKALELRPVNFPLTSFSDVERLIPVVDLEQYAERPEFFEVQDPQDNEIELSERAQRNEAAREHAYEAGIEEALAPAPSEADLLARFEHPKLVRDYLDGRANGQ